MLSLFGADTGCCCSPVMAVRHVECIDILGEYLRDPAVDGVILDYPEGVAELVLVGELVFGLARSHLCDYRGELLMVLEGEEYRFDIGVLDAHVDHAVVFLVLAGELVLLDFAGGIIVRVSAEDEAVLRALAHGLGVHIVLLAVLADEPATLLPELEILDGLVVGALLVFAGDGIEINLRLCDMEEGLLSRHRLGFFRIENVVRRGGYLGHEVFGRPNGCEWLYSYHNYLFTWNLRSPVAKKLIIWRAAATPAFILASAVWAPIFLGVANTRRPKRSRSSA